MSEEAKITKKSIIVLIAIYKSWLHGLVEVRPFGSVTFS